VVISADPLTIKLGDLQIGKENILIADYLLKDYEREIEIAETDGSGTMSSESVGDHGSHTHSISKIAVAEGGIVKFTNNGLEADDIVALTPTPDGQTYIVLAKLVEP
jgi:hypothetical protein